jgi:hypothetical protein
MRGHAGGNAPRACCPSIAVCPPLVDEPSPVRLPAMMPLAAGRTGAFAAVTAPATLRVARVGRRITLGIE